MKVGFFLLKCINTIQIQNMKMDIEIKASPPEALNKSYRICFSFGLSLYTGLFDEICENSFMDQVEDIPHQLRVFGKQETERKRET